MSSGPQAPASPDGRVALAIAVVAAGGLLSPFAGVAGVVAALAVVLVARGLVGPGAASWPRNQARWGWAEPLGLALLLALLVRALARTVIATPALLLALPLAAGLAWTISRLSSSRGRWLAALGLAGLLAGAGLLGLAVERAGPTPHGMVRSGPLLGVHPRQAVAVTIDGFGPHDVIADDYVEPDGSQGRDPQSWAERLETELHAIAQRHYAEGPARAREAFGRAEVALADPIVVPSERGLHEWLVGLEIRSGTAGEGSRVEFGCPGAVIDPRPGPTSTPSADCPRKYARDGSTGLGLSPRWPGYTEFRGRDRLRIARALGWPSGDEADDRRTLAIELGLITLGLLAGVLVLARHAGGRRAANEPAILGLLALFGVALVRPSGAIGSVELGMLLPLAPLLLVVGRAGPLGAVPTRTRWVLVGLILALGLSPLAGHAGVLGLDASLRELLVVDVGASWGSASVIAGTITILAIVPGTSACARGLMEGSGPGTVVGRAILAGAIGLGLAMRKVDVDPALLTGATAILLACWLPAEPPTLRRRAAAMVLAAITAVPLVRPGLADPVALGSIAALALLTLLIGWFPARTRLEP